MVGKKSVAAVVLGCTMMAAGCAVPFTGFSNGISDVNVDVTPMAEAPIPNRVGATAVWTGSEVIYWGGRSGDKTGHDHGDGAAYNPATDTWRVLAPSPLAARSNHLAAWTGHEMIVWGGTHDVFDVGQTNFYDGASYDPTTDTWRLIAEPTEEAVGVPREIPTLASSPALVVGGNVFFPTANFVVLLDAENGDWRRIEVDHPDFEVRYRAARFVAHEGAVYLMTRGWNETDGRVILVTAVDPASGEVIDIDVITGPQDYPILTSTPAGLALLVADDEQNWAVMKQGDDWVEVDSLNEGLLRETRQDDGKPVLSANNQLILPSTFQLYFVDLSSYEATKADIDLATSCALGPSSVVAEGQLIAWNGTGCIMAGDDGVETEITGGVVISLP